MKAYHVAAWIVVVLVFWTLIAATHDQAPVEIRVNPRVLLSGGAFWLTCKVKRDAANRILDYGVVNYREHSQRQLDGTDSPVTFQTLVEHVPCAVGPAYCQVGKTDGSWQRAVAEIEIGGCDP